MPRKFTSYEESMEEAEEVLPLPHVGYRVILLSVK